MSSGTGLLLLLLLLWLGIVIRGEDEGVGITGR